MLHQSSGGGGEESCQAAVAFLLGCWSVVLVVTSLMGGVSSATVVELCSTKVVIPRGQKFDGLGAPAHDFGVSRAVGYLCCSEDLQGAWMELPAGLWLISA